MRKREIKPLSQLTLADNFMFGIVMTRPNVCKLFLEELLGEKIERIDYIDREKDISDTYGFHGIRLDVYLADGKGTVYNIEMQKRDMENTPKRARYYQSGMDRVTLRTGVDYEELAKSFVIFVCAYDAFGREQMVYKKTSFVNGDLSIPYDDGSEVIILNACYKYDNSGNEAIREFLDLVGSEDISGSYRSDLAKEAALAISETRNNKGLEGVYMTYARAMADERKIGREEGREEGRAEVLREAVCAVYDNVHDTAKVAELLKIDEEKVLAILSTAHPD